MQMTCDGEALKIVVDLTTEIGPSSSGKTTLLASSGGNVEVIGDTVIWEPIDTLAAVINAPGVQEIR